MFKIMMLFTFCTLGIGRVFATSTDSCFQLKYHEDTYQVRITQTSEQNYTLKLDGVSGLSLDVQCVGAEEPLVCQGDDDSANFKLSLKTKKVEVNHLTFGEPDSATKSFLFLKKPGSFELGKCAQ